MTMLFFSNFFLEVNVFSCYDLNLELPTNPFHPFADDSFRMVNNLSFFQMLYGHFKIIDYSSSGRTIGVSEGPQGRGACIKRTGYISIRHTLFCQRIMKKKTLGNFAKSVSLFSSIMRFRYRRI